MCVVGVVALLLFGNQLPKMARSFGSILPSFKAGMKDAVDEIDAIKKEAKEAKAMAAGMITEATSIVNAEIREAESAVHSTIKS